MTPVSISQLEGQIGQEVGVSDWIQITQPMIDDFAKVTGDHQFIHVDPVRAKAESPFGGTIAHGFLTLSLANQMFACLPDMQDRKMLINYGCNKLRFLTPVPAGGRGRITLAEINQKSENQYLIMHKVSIEIEGKDSPALVAEWLGLSIF